MMPNDIVVITQKTESSDPIFQGVNSYVVNIGGISIPVDRDTFLEVEVGQKYRVRFEEAY